MNEDTLDRAEPDSVAPNQRQTFAPELSLLALLLIPVVVVCAAIDWQPGYRVTTLVFCLIGLGSAPWALRSNLAFYERLTLSLATSLSAIILLSFLMVEANWWHPIPTFIAVAGAAVALHGVALVRGWPHRHRFRVPAVNQSAVVVGALLLGAALVCLIAAVAARTNIIGYSGLLGSVGPLWYVGMAVIVAIAAYCCAARRAALPPALPVAVFGLIFTLTPSIMYGYPRSQSAEKHIELARLIQQTHALKSSFAIYNDWPGMFSGVAWLSDVTNVHNLTALATFWPPLMLVFRLPALRTLAARFFHDDQLAWGVVLLALLADSIGADYFSPQSVGFVLGLTVFGVILGTSLPIRQRAATVFLITAAIAVSHQLSPYIVLGVCIVLVAFRLIRPWWIVLMVFFPTVAWSAIHGGAIAHYLTFGSVGNASNFALPSQQKHNDPRALVTLAIAAAAFLVVVLIGYGAVTVLRTRTRINWALVITSAVGLIIVTITAYGNEGIFRAVLFSLPWLAILATGTLFTIGRVRWRMWLAVPTTLAMLAALLVATFGLDGGATMRKADVDYLRHMTQVAKRHPDEHYLLISIGDGDEPAAVPTAPLNFDTSRIGKIFYPNDTTRAHVARAISVLNRALSYTKFFLPKGPKHIYLYTTRAGLAYDELYGIASPAVHQAMLQAMLHSRDYRVVSRANGQLVLEFVGPALKPSGG